MVPSVKRIFRHWKRIYLVCCLVYGGWVIHAGWPEFLKVNHQYQVLASQLEPHRIRAIALEELAAECRRGLRQQNIPDRNPGTEKSAEIREIREKSGQKSGDTIPFFEKSGDTIPFLEIVVSRNSKRKNRQEGLAGWLRLRRQR